jgi:hypothetical protein
MHHQVIAKWDTTVSKTQQHQIPSQLTQMIPMETLQTSDHAPKVTIVQWLLGSLSLVLQELSLIPRSWDQLLNAHHVPRVCSVQMQH